jgi:hypothetical protein
MNLKKRLIIVHAQNLEFYRIGRVRFATQAVTLVDQTFYMEMPIRLEEMKDYEKDRDQPATHESLLG